MSEREPDAKRRAFPFDGRDIDLAGVAYDPHGSMTLQSGNVLHVVQDGQAYDLHFDPAQVLFTQTIGASDALRTGAYAKTLTFTLSTTAP